MIIRKKHLGQHFLQDENIAKKIVRSVKDAGDGSDVLEIGPGKGVLTALLLPIYGPRLKVVEIDPQMIAYLKHHLSLTDEQIIAKDFLLTDPAQLTAQQLTIIGNFPYNISSQIMFRILDMKDRVKGMVGMFQKEVAQRLCSKPHQKSYGILSVLTQTWYDVEYLFDVSKSCFAPPPKVESGVIRIARKALQPQVDPQHLTGVVKAAFNQRRKTLRNSLSQFELSQVEANLLKARAEELSTEQFLALAQKIPPYA